MTKELERQFTKIGRQEGENDPIAVAKFFNPVGQGMWLATELYCAVKIGQPYTFSPFLQVIERNL